MTDGGRTYIAIPGPSVIPDRVLRAMQRPSPDIYDPEFLGMVRSVLADLRAVAGTSQNLAAYIGNGHAAWEAANTNLFSRGDKALVLSTGLFGTGWAGVAREMGVEVEVLDFGRGPADMARVEAALRADRAGAIRAVLTTHVDTASSVRTDVRALRAAMDAAGHPALLAVDAIASLGCDEYRMDDWGVDVTVAASQKGLMTPPGMAFVWFSDRAAEACRASGLRTPYWNWTPRTDDADLSRLFGGTAPTQQLYGLREALEMLVHEEGLAAAWARHERLARAVWAAFDRWSEGNPAIKLHVADPAFRGRSVTAARLGPPDAQRLREWTRVQAGVTLGIGLGMRTPEDPNAEGSMRLAHMGHVNAHMTLGALAAIEAGMQALGIAHGSGAVEAAAGVIAG